MADKPPHSPSCPDAPSAPARAHAPGHQSADPPSVWGPVPPRNPNFTGRQTLLDQLPEQLRDSAAAGVAVAVHGLSGTGTTQVAAKYCYRHPGDYDLIWWIHATTTATLHTGLTGLATALALPEAGDPRRAVPAVLEALRTGRPYRRWLLVFDAAPDPAVPATHQLRPPADHFPLHRLGRVSPAPAAAAVQPG